MMKQHNKRIKFNALKGDILRRMWKWSQNNAINVVNIFIRFSKKRNFQNLLRRRHRTLNNLNSKINQIELDIIVSKFR